MSRVDAKTNSLTKGLTQNLFKIPFTRDKSIKFDGTDDVITTTADSTLATKTYSFWAKSSDASGNHVFDHGGEFSGALQFHYGSSHILWMNGGYVFWPKTPESSDGNWHHHLFVVNTVYANSKWYQDGVLQAQTSNSAHGASTTSYSTGIRIGRGGNNYWNGSLDEFAIFDGDQSSLAVELYNNGQPTNLSSYSTLDHWFRMGEGKLGTNSDGDSNILFQGIEYTGSELLTNGDFSTDTDWTDYLASSSGGSVVITGGQLKITQGSNSVWMGASQSFSITQGKTYSVRGTYSGGNSHGRIKVGNSAGNDTYLDASSLTPGNKLVQFTATATGTAHITLLDGQGATNIGYWDNVSVKEARGQQVGGELVTDGGFSDTLNWLELGDAVVENGVGTFPTSTSNSFIIKTGAVPATVAVYKLQYDVVSTNGNTLQLAGGSSAFPTTALASSVGTHSVFVTSNGTNTNLQFNNNSSFIGSIDNVSLKEVQNVGTISGAEIQADGGSELIVNGTFDSNVTSWPVSSGGTVTWSNGTAITGAVGTDDRGGMSQTFTTVNGRNYTLSFSVISRTSTKWEVYRQGTGPGTIIEGTALGSHKITFTAASNSTELAFYAKQAGTSDGTVAWDNISVKEVTESVPKQTQNLPSGASKKSMDFDGTDDFALIPYELPGTTFTVSQWIKVKEDSSTNASVYVWDARDASNTNGNIFLPAKTAATTYKLRWYNAGAYRIDNSTTYPIGLWQHVVLVKDGTTGTIYVDGEKLETATGFSSPDNGAEINLGRRYAATFAYGEMDVDEFAIWDTVLDGDAIRALYNAGLPTPVTTKTGAYDIYRDNLKAYYKMGDATNPAADGTSNLLFDQTSPGLGPELVKADAYASGSWTTSNTAEFGSNFAKFTRPSSGGSLNAADSYLGGANTSITSAGLTVGATYKVSVDFETDDADVYIRVWTGAAYVVSTSGSGTKVIYFTATHATNPLFRTSNQLDATKFVKFSNISIKEVNGHTGTISGATIQTESPKQIYALPPVANTKSLNFDGSNDYLQTQVDSVAQPNNESRYYSWWSKSSDSGAQYMWDHGAHPIGGFGFNISVGRPLLYMSASVFRYFEANTLCDDGKWHHWVVRIKYNDITGCELWCDGVKQGVSADGNTGSMNTYTSGIKIGRAGAGYFNGSLDEFSIHEDLDEEAIRALFNRGRPIDISKSQGAYDLSDKALHYWRMGDATSPAADGTNDIIFQGLEFESDEMFPTNPSSSDWDSLGAMTWDGTTLTYAGTGGEQAFAKYAFTLSVGQTFRLNVDVTNDGTGNFFARIGDGTNALAISNVTTGSYELVHTVTESGANNMLFFIVNGGFSGTISNISLNRIRGQYIGKELTIANPYDSSKWTTYGNIITNPSTTSIRAARGASGGSNSALQAALASNGILTGNVTVGKTYKLTFDFETDETSGTIALARFYDGSSYTTLQTGSGSVEYYFTAANAGLALGSIELSPNQYVQFSNISLKEVGGAAVMTNMTTSDIQTDTPY